MRSHPAWLVALTFAAVPALAQESSTSSYETRIESNGKTVTYTGTVVEYVPRKTIVIRDSTDHVLRYTLPPEIALPSDLETGKTVSVLVEPQESGGQVVRRVTTTRTVTPEGETRTTTRSTEISPPDQSASSEETLEGVVSRYKAKRSITLQRPDGSSVTYLLDRSTAVPAHLETGHRVVLRLSRSGNPRVVRTVTFSNASE